MLNLKDTETDDLFRRASDKYPLRTDSADWDKMDASLDKDPTPGQLDGTRSDDRRRKRRVFWLLLFLPLAGVGYYALHRTGQTLSHPGVVVVTGSGNQQSAGPNNHTIQKAGRTDPSNTSTASDTREPSPAAAAASPQTAAGGEQTAAGSQQTAAEAHQTAAGSQQRSPTSATTLAGNGHIPAGTSLFAARSTHLSTRHQAGKDRATTDPDASPGSSGRFSADEPLDLRWDGDMQLVLIPRNYSLSVNVTAPPAAKSNEPVKQKPAKTKTKSSYFYAGILGAPDISTVKMQSVKGVGSTIGLMLGYAFNSRWSIETGAYLDQKRYYTEGEYFNTEKVNLPFNPSYGQLLNVDGTCYMWEIPLNVRYIFNPQGKTRWFATAGLSTYLMSKENYTYAYQKTASGITRDSAWNIKRPSQYPFSIVNLSAGFEQRLGRVGNLRVEPYARLPLAGIGTGKLPIMSLGINIGITRRLW